MRKYIFTDEERARLHKFIKDGDRSDGFMRTLIFRIKESEKTILSDRNLLVFALRKIRETPLT